MKTLTQSQKDLLAKHSEHHSSEAHGRDEKANESRRYFYPSP